MQSVTIPLINPNEPEAIVTALHVSEGQRVAAGDPLCTLETTKATAEVVADGKGYIAGLRVDVGQTLRAGDVLCYLADKPGEVSSAPDILGYDDDQGELPAGLRITQPALALARANQVDLGSLPREHLITEATVRKMLDTDARPGLDSPRVAFDPRAIIVYGGGGHGKSLIDLLLTLGTYRIVGVVDDSLEKGSLVLDVPVLGGEAALGDLYADGVRLAVNAVGGIGDVSVRIKVFHKLAEAGYGCPAVAHPSAIIEPSAELDSGVQTFPHAYIGSDARLGFGVIVNTGAIVSHDCVLADYANISPGAMLAGGVHVGTAALVGMGATVNLGVSIGAGSRIGNGATVKSDVPDRGLVRAGGVWPQDA